MAGLRAIRSRHLSIYDTGRTVPKTRGECRDAVRPCPRITCRYHLANDDNGTAGIRLNPGMVALIADQLENDLPPTFDTCALDVADRGESTVYEISELMSIWHSNVEPAIQSGAEKIRDSADGQELWRRLLEDGSG
jgi:hypothetical protein